MAHLFGVHDRWFYRKTFILSQDFIWQQPTAITEFDETLVSRLIMKIPVFADHFTVEFMSGINIDIAAKNKAPRRR